MGDVTTKAALLALALSAVAPAARAQMHDMPGMTMSHADSMAMHGGAHHPAKPPTAAKPRATKARTTKPAGATKTKRAPAKPHDAAMHHDTAAPPEASSGHTMHGMDMPGMAGMPGMPGMAHEHGTHARTGLYGPYPMTREASGTAWQPDAAEHAGIHAMRGPWMLMLHGMADLAWDHANGPRGDEKTFSANMLMGTARRPLGAGTLGLRAMLSAEPATIGKRGYPLLLQTGETADGVTPLIDRQHPHDLFMELAGTYSVARGKNSVFLYAGLPGEPALGPPAFMHRFSGASIPVAPITHHWLDSTHITYGVLTAGAVIDRVKVEASAFHGREPDENRWNIETPKLDSQSFRLSVNPTDRVALQVSYGRLESPEQLEPEIDQDRTTASAVVDGRWSDGRWEGTVAWGRTRNRPGHLLDALSAEAAAELRDTHTLFARAEHVEKDELFEAADPRAGRGFHVGEVTAGYRYDFHRTEHLRAGLGLMGTVALVPDEIHDAYGESPGSVVIFLHAGLR